MKTETKARVLILQGHDYPRLVRRALSLWDPSRALFKDKTVFIKPNWVSDSARLLTTHPDLLQALVRAAVKSGAKRVMVGDNPAIGITSQQIYSNTGWGRRIEAEGGEIIHLDETAYTMLSLKEGFPWKEIPVPEPVLKSDFFINVPVAKTHCQGVLSLGIKNLIGLLNDEWKERYHREDLHYKAVAVLSVLRPHLTIIDGMVAGEGQGPVLCERVDWGTLFLGNDPVATDAVCSACMGYVPSEVHTTRIAQQLGLGSSDLDSISVEGKRIKDVFRLFKRATLGVAGRYPCEVRASGACEGCIAWIQARMDRWNEEGIWPKVLKRGKMVLAVGSQASASDIADLDHCNLLAFGDCVPEDIRARSNTFIIPGCPPTGNIGPLLEEFLRKIGVR